MITKRAGRNSIQDLQVRLAEYLIQFEEGNQLPSVRELAATTRMSIGSVSTALNSLQEMGAATIQKRGHMGSLVLSLSRSKLWGVIEKGPMVIGMTLPMHSRFEGLATGLKRSLDRAGIETYLIFIRGSRTRLKALKDNRCHVAVMSGLASEELGQKDFETILSLPPGSWVSGYSIFYRPSAISQEHAMRVAIDPDSFDHRRLTELEFEGQEVQFKSAPFVQFPRLIKNGEVDAILWTTDQEEAYLGDDISYRALSPHVMKMAGDKSISATLVTRPESTAIRAVFLANIDIDEILAIQKKIVLGEMIPEY